MKLDPANNKSLKFNNSLDALVKEAISLRQKNNPKQALALLNDSLGAGLHDYAFLHELAVIYNILGSFDLALKFATSASIINPKSAENYNLLGVIMLKKGMAVERAEKMFEIALNVNPQHLKARYHLGICKSNNGKFEEAKNIFLKCLEIDNNDAHSYHELGIVYNRLGDNKKAIENFKQATRFAPNLALPWAHLGKLYITENLNNKALECFEKAFALLPNLENEAAVAEALMALDKTEEALKICQNMETKNPDNYGVLVLKGGCLTNLGKIDEAIETFQKAIKLQPEIASAYFNLSRIKKYLNDNEAETDQIKNLLATKKNLNEREQVDFNFTLGKIYDDCKKYDKAFYHYKKANKLYHKILQPKLVNMTRDTDYICQHFNKEFFKARHNYGSSSDLPITIVGMSRSGGTLVENIISSHSKVTALGESIELAKTALLLNEYLQSKTPYPDIIAELDKKNCLKIANQYLETIKEQQGKIERITDKFPMHYFHLGLIALLFPNSKIVHTKRHPLDVCLSNFFQIFRHGGKYSYSFDNLAEIYKCYFRLMKHWHEHLPIKIYDIYYEQLVNDQEKQISQLIDYCNLPWEEQCLTPQNNNRIVSTASKWQVRQGVYQSSSYRWKNYKKHLKPLAHMLKDEIASYEAELKGQTG